MDKRCAKSFAMAQIVVIFLKSSCLISIHMPISLLHWYYTVDVFCTSICIIIPEAMLTSLSILLFGRPAVPNAPQLSVSAKLNGLEVSCSSGDQDTYCNVTIQMNGAVQSVLQILHSMDWPVTWCTQLVQELLIGVEIIQRKVHHIGHVRLN